jgi:hypothetical protein
MVNNLSNVSLKPSLKLSSVDLSLLSSLIFRCYSSPISLYQPSSIPLTSFFLINFNTNNIKLKKNNVGKGDDKKSHNSGFFDENSIIKYNSLNDYLFSKSRSNFSSFSFSSFFHFLLPSHSNAAELLLVFILFFLNDAIFFFFYIVLCLAHIG